MPHLPLHPQSQRVYVDPYLFLIRFETGFSDLQVSRTPAFLLIQTILDVSSLSAASDGFIRREAIVCKRASIATVLEPSGPALRKRVELWHIGLDIQQRRTVEDINPPDDQ